jgi:biotin carboxyl carrier protein
VPRTAHSFNPMLQTAASPLALYADILASRSLAAAAHRLVAALAREHGCDRVSLGLQRAGATRLVASTALAVADTRAELAERLVGAMDEALEQGVRLALPPAAGSAGGPAPVTLEHGLLQRAVGGAVATLPVGVDGEPIGALCLERHAAGATFEAAELERLEHVLVLALPALRWMERADEPFARRARREISRAAAALRHPGRRTLRRGLASGAALLAVLAFAPLEQEVGGRARIEGAQQRIVAAPADGFVKTVHVRPGDSVRAGAPLVDLLDADLRLEHDRLSSQLAQHENAYAAAMAKSDRVAAATSLAAVGEAQAQLALVDGQLARGRIVAPFDGLVIQGDLAQSVGAPVRQGDALLTLATTGRERVIVEVDEVDIARIHPGQPGTLALSALPWSQRTLVVERIAPLARAVEGRNVFEVQARLTDGEASPRPGLLGHAEIVIGRGPLLAAWARHVADRLRVAWWNWLGA